MGDRFTNRVAIVTGGSTGIGAATVARLVSEGAIVTVADIRSRGHVPGVHYVACDVTDMSAVEAMVQTTFERFGRLDVLVNNAGIGCFGETEELPLETWDRVFAINVTAIFHTCRFAIPAMRQGGGGAIVNVASISGIAGDYGFSAYSASKGAVVNFTRTLALDGSRDNIRANTLCPGAIAQTAMGVGTHGSAEDLREWTDNIPLGRYGTPDEMANVIAFLASDEASYITGATIIADGGITAHTGQPNIARQRRRRAPVV